MAAARTGRRHPDGSMNKRPRARARGGKEQGRVALRVQLSQHAGLPFALMPSNPTCQEPDYPTELTVPCRALTGRELVAEVPGSKSLTNRALIMAALCKDAAVVLKRPLHSEDTVLAREALERLGAEIRDLTGGGLEVRGGGLRDPEEREKPLYLGNAGTVVRLLTGALAGAGVGCVIDGNERMRERPMGPLLTGIRDLGGEIRARNGNDCPPLMLSGVKLRGGETAVSGQVSSQVFSGLMIGAAQAEKESIIRVTDEWLSRPYIEMTARMLAEFGVGASVHEGNIEIAGGQKFISPGEWEIEADASTASYPLALGMLHGVPVEIPGLGEDSLQGDVEFAKWLTQMGAKLNFQSSPRSLRITPPQNGFSALPHADLSNIPDAAMTLVTLLAVAQGRSKLTGLRNLAFKECDRLHALETELSKMGGKVLANPDGFEIVGVPVQQMRPAKISTYNDHRVAMCLALLGTMVEGVVVENPACVSKSFPHFWTALEQWLGES